LVLAKTKSEAIMSTPSPDAPISKPEDDLYGIEPFARVLAKSIADMKAPEGIVIGVNGVWGSGKTSALGLVRHHLDANVMNDEVVIIDFSPWWFTSQEALIRGFFQELGTKIEKSLGEKVKGAFRSIGKRVSGVGEAAGGAVDAGTGVPGASAAVKGAAEMVGGWLGAEETVVEAQERLARRLGEQKRRFLVVIDDIDRLVPDDALALFKLVKSVGRMPNVIYLLAFDRPLAEKVLKDRYPAEGAHYLEKIVQAWFDLPVPTEFDLRQVFLTRLEEITGPAADSEADVGLMNAFYGIVARHLKTPRDVVRLINILRVSYPPVRGEVDVGDFLGIEAMRLFQPELHAVIARNEKRLCGRLRDEGELPEAKRTGYDELMLAGVGEADRETIREALCRLFPRLESVWGGYGYGEGFEEEWRSKRRICSNVHFGSYFRFGLSDETISAKELTALIERADDAAAVQGALRQGVKTRRRMGGTRAAVLLEELMANADRIAGEKVSAFLAAVFAMADELNVEADEPAPFETANNRFRLHGLMNKLLLRRFPLVERSIIVVEAAKGASLGWVADLAERCAKHKKGQQADGDRLVDDNAADAVVALAAGSLKAAAEDGNLSARADVCVLLHRWRRLAADGEAAARILVKSSMGDDAFIVRLADSTISTSGVHSSGDLVARRERSVRPEAITPFVDLSEFTRRVEEVSAKPGLDEKSTRILADFRNLPKENEN
jgi:predicted KAP-like P-loop ATPase